MLIHRGTNVTNYVDYVTTFRPGERRIPITKGHKVELRFV